MKCLRKCKERVSLVVGDVGLEVITARMSNAITGPSWEIGFKWWAKVVDGADFARTFGLHPKIPHIN